MQRRNPYQPALEKARDDLRRLDPHGVALRSGSRVGGGPAGPTIELAYWGQPVEVSWVNGDVRSAVPNPALRPVVQLLVLHYLITADGTSLADRWVSFRELADGRVYDAAFRRRACQPLALAFGDRPGSLVAAGQRLDARPLSYGDVSFMFQILPRIRVAAILHARDDEFAAEVSMLFDATMRHYLPIEDVAVLGGLVAGSLLQAQRVGGYAG